MARPQNRRRIATFAVAVLLVQVLVPRGYMPASLASGWFVALCPDGLTTPEMVVLIGAQQSQDQHHHGHVEHVEHERKHHAMHQSHGADGTADPSRLCELAGLYVDALEATAFVAELPERPTLDSLDLDPATPPGPGIRHFSPRAPPLA
ncbi:MAG: hypothetical protein AAGI72_02085 [Pseudomonadota bacterium]